MRIRPLAVKVCWSASIHSCHFLLMRSLNGLLIATSRGCTILVIPPGITTGSVLRDLSMLRIGADKCALNESHTSIDFFLVRPPTLLHTVLSQSYKSPWSIHPFSWHRTITSFGKFAFFGSVFRLKMTYGGSFVSSPRQAIITVNLSFSWPLVQIDTLFTPFSDTVEFVTMSKVSGVWSAFPMYFSSKSCFFLWAMT